MATYGGGITAGTTKTFTDVTPGSSSVAYTVPTGKYAYFIPLTTDGLTGSGTSNGTFTVENDNGLGGWAANALQSSIGSGAGVGYDTIPVNQLTGAPPYGAISLFYGQRIKLVNTAVSLGGTNIRFSYSIVEFFAST